MSLRTRDNSLQVSLFPLSNILKCVMCLLFLVICSQVIAGSWAQHNLAARLDEARKRAADLTLIRSQSDDLSRDSDARQLLARIIEAEEQEKAAKAAIEKARKVHETLIAEKSRTEEAVYAKEALAEAHRLLAERDEFQKALAQLQSESAVLKEKQSAFAAAAAIPQAIQVRREGEEKGAQVPFFADCRLDKIVLYEGTRSWREVQTSKIAESDDFASFVKKAADAPGGLVVLLVRTDGVPTHDRAEGVSIGKHKLDRVKLTRLPVPGSGELDLSAFVPNEQAGGEK